ncbi:hypothetical protein BCR33DRAFT_713005 [Rhizoclosmatium globosum]|uniref:SH3 domain-containing protein n=1 Tax=Rhizoclosmatium globosum TaxID=329046 RepID=A0A1Y2CW75_9FUNG|nr:hypothetical protein BCR33DRAFT_713005 [Rhizoclosmatium globosum]|eukprot:ORY51084.1 hypothetical protein BCR33DRAFT_713005 [Rhizoclosmatium globosum]
MLANAEAIPTHKFLKGKRMTAVFKFIPDTSEELSIEVGDAITIVEVFDDGSWMCEGTKE